MAVKTGLFCLLAGLISGWSAHYFVSGHAGQRPGFDHSGDGKLDEVFITEKGVLTAVEIDRNLDGENDFILTFLPSGHLSESISDDNFDGHFETTSNYVNNQLSSSRVDTNKDGNVDTLWYYTNGVLEKSFIINPETKMKQVMSEYSLGKLVKSHIDTSHDGVFDVECEYDYFEERKCSPIVR